MAKLTYDGLPSNLKLRDYQVESLKKAKKYFSQKENQNKSFLVTYPMGAGKSHMISIMALVESGSVLILSPSLEIKEQLIRRTKEFKKSLGEEKKIVTRLEDLLEKDSFDGNYIAIGTYQLLHSIYKNRKSVFKKIKTAFKIALIDEGHREPSPKWSFAVRNIEIPKYLFSATPYRNDFNVFEIDADAVDIKSYNQLLEYKNNGQPILRTVDEKKGDWKKNNTKSFCDVFIDSFEDVCSKSNLKAIVRCSYDTDIRKIVDHLNEKIPNIAVGIHSNFSKDDNKNNLYNSYYEVPTDVTKYQIYVHQYKLLEGVDNSDFILLAFFDDLQSERAVVQQIGRILRYKDRKKATLLIHSTSHIGETWKNYKKFDLTLESEQTLWGIKQFSKNFMENINKIIYENTRFKHTLNFDLPVGSIFESLRFKHSVNASQINEEASFEDLILSIEEDLSDTQKIFRILKSDIENTKKSFSNFFILCFIRTENSKIIEDFFFPELTIEFVSIFQIGTRIFLYTSGRSALPGLALKTSSIERERLVRVFGESPTFSQVSLNNMDISDSALRQRMVRARNLNQSLSSNLDFSYYLSNSVYKKNNGGRGYLGIENGKITDFKSKLINARQYMDWILAINTKLDDSSAQDLSFLNRFAQVEEGPSIIVPTHILLDLFQAEDFISKNIEDINCYELLESIDKAFPVIEETISGRKKFKFEFPINASKFEVYVKFSKSKRCKLSLKKKFASKGEEGNFQIAKAFITELNKSQQYRVIFQDTDLVYSLGKFFRQAELSALGSVIIKDNSLSIDISEKGDELLTSTTSRSWKRSVFKHVADYESTSSSPLHKHLRGIDYLVCDDRGGTKSEIADFIAIICSGTIKKIILIHCKSDKGHNTRATALYAITAQAIKNLRYLNPLSGELNFESTRFSDNFNLKTYNIGRILSFKGQQKNAQNFIDQYNDLIKDPSTEKEVWFAIGGGAVAEEIKESFSSRDPIEDYLVQVKHILYSAWANVSSAGAKLKIFC